MQLSFAGLFENRAKISRELFRAQAQQDGQTALKMKGDVNCRSRLVRLIAPLRASDTVQPRVMRPLPLQRFHAGKQRSRVSDLSCVFGFGELDGQMVFSSSGAAFASVRGPPNRESILPKVNCRVARHLGVILTSVLAAGRADVTDGRSSEQDVLR
jgi:hypothetical protein